MYFVELFNEVKVRSRAAKDLTGFENTALSATVVSDEDRELTEVQRDVVKRAHARYAYFRQARFTGDRLCLPRARLGAPAFRGHSGMLRRPTHRGERGPA